MKPDASHIRQIFVVSNTHWDREFRRSFEKTRRRLLTMFDTTLDVLASDPSFPSFTLDGHTILVDDYLEMRPERRAQVEEFIRTGRLIIGPWHTLPEQFSISAEALVRNLQRGRERVLACGAKPGTVAYTPASWGQTGQLPQILAEFGLTRMMFYRGVSHDECDAEWIWEGADGTRVLATRFAIYARYNWYYQVHRPATRGRTFAKDYAWGEFDDGLFRFADGLAGEDLAFDAKAPQVTYDPSRLRDAIEHMVQREGPHFTTPVFLAMNGHDISVAFPLESQMVADAQAAVGDRYEIRHANLEEAWDAIERHLDKDALPVLRGERRSYLRKGMWTYLMPATISARTYLKQRDFAASAALTSYAEPFAALAAAHGAPVPERYLRRAWDYLLSNHTHDANGGCAPDAVCLDMEYRYRKVQDIADIVVEDAMAHVAANLEPALLPADAMLLLVFNPLPFERDVVAQLDLEIPRSSPAKSVRLAHERDPDVARQPVCSERSSSFVDNIWDVPTILDSDRVRFHAHLRRLPALGWRAYRLQADDVELRPPHTLICGPNAMENEYLHLTVNPNGTLTILNKATGMVYENLNYLSDQGEVGNAWWHKTPRHDRKYVSLGVAARVAVIESGPLVSRIVAEYDFDVPQDCAEGQSRSTQMVSLPVRVEYRLTAVEPRVDVTITVDNRARDHWLRANFPTGLETNETWADSHFDVVSRPIPLPDSTGWVERAEGTHPLRTFVAMRAGQDGIAVYPKGLYEYEAFEDERRTLALTLIRACRIKLAVSEEKQTELADQGVQCPGMQKFEYAVEILNGAVEPAALVNRAAHYHAPVRAAMISRGKGALPHEAALLEVRNPALHVSCCKPVPDRHAFVVRVVNPSPKPQPLDLRAGGTVKSITRIGMAEDRCEPVCPEATLAPKKVETFLVELECS